jgi:predicted RNA methylase
MKSISNIIDTLDNKLLDDTLPREETVRIMKLASILDWEREKATITPENIDKKIDAAKRLQKKSQSGFGLWI